MKKSVLLGILVIFALLLPLSARAESEGDNDFDQIKSVPLRAVLFPLNLVGDFVGNTVGWFGAGAVGVYRNYTDPSWGFLNMAFSPLTGLAFGITDAIQGYPFWYPVVTREEIPQLAPKRAAQPQ